MRPVFINSLPKSGTNLVAKALQLFGYKALHTVAVTIRDDIPYSWVRQICSTFDNKYYSIGVDVPKKVPQIYVNYLISKINKAEFRGGHIVDSSFYQLLGNKNVSPILIVRDPRAVLASYVPYVKRFKGHRLYPLFKSMSEIDAYQFALHGGEWKGILQPSLLNRCLQIDAMKKDFKDTQLTLRFEDIVGAKGGGDDALQVQALQNLANFTQADSKRIDFVQKNLFGEGRDTFRKGQIHSWTEEMPKEIIEESSELLTSIIEKWGYSKV